MSHFRIHLAAFPELKRLKKSGDFYFWGDTDNPHIKIKSRRSNPFDTLSVWYCSAIRRYTDESETYADSMQIHDMYDGHEIYERMIGDDSLPIYALEREVSFNDNFLHLQYETRKIIAVFPQIGKYRKMPTGKLIAYYLKECDKMGKMYSV